MKTSGYAGKVLRVNLTTRAIETEALDMELARKFIGPEGILFRWAYDLMTPKIDPYAETCPILIGSGPVVGTPVPGSSRVCALFKHPNYGGVIENSHAGGDLGPMLKWAGYDYLVVTGKAEGPVYLHIRNDDVAICDAGQIWGKDIYEATDLLWEKHDNAAVLAIGPAGERLVKTTVALVDKVHSLGKGGLPAVMGSKKLKAIVVNGTRGLRVADPARLKKIVVPMMERIKNHPNLKKCIDLGSMTGFPVWFQRMGASHRNWSTTLPVEEAFKRYGVEVYEKNIRKDRVVCFACPAGCKDHLRIREGQFAGLETYCSSLYGRVENLAARCDVGTFNGVVKALDYCERMGLCIHEITAMIDWAIDLFKHAMIDERDTGGLVLDWNLETTLRLLEQVATREGLGTILGEGMLTAIQQIGRGCEKRAIHIKGMSPLYDARINRLGIAEFGEVINPKGGHQGRTPLPALYLTRDVPDADKIAKAWAEKERLPEDAIRRIFETPGRFNIGRLTKWTQERRLLFNSLGIGCSRERSGNLFSLEEAVDIYGAVTGLETSAEELHEVASRSFNMIKVLNLREGFTRKDDRFPDRWFEPVTRHGQVTLLEDYFGKTLTREDCEKILDDYYDESGWDIQLGIPTKTRLTELGLEDVAEDLEKSGFLPA